MKMSERKPAEHDLSSRGDDEAEDLDGNSSLRCNLAIRTVRDGVTGLTLHIVLVPRVESDGLHSSLEWWRERAARLQADVQELGH